MNTPQKNILFVTHICPHLACIGSLRIGEWIKYWSRDGHDVTVLTSYTYPFIGSNNLNIDIPKNVKFIELQYLPKFIFGTEESKPIKQDKILLSQPKWLLEMKEFVHFLRNYIGYAFDLSDLWVNKATKVGLNLMKLNKYDMIISSHGPPASNKVAANIKKRYPAIPWIADYRDPWAGNPIITARGIFKKIEQYQEQNTTGKYATAITTVSNGYAQIIKNQLQKKIYVIENGFDTEKFNDWETRLTNLSSSSLTDKSSPMVISLTGKLYTNKPDISSLFKVINKLIKNNFIKEGQIEVHFYGSDHGNLEKIIKKEKASNWVKTFGKVSNLEAIKAQQNSDLLLLAIDDIDGNNGVISGKTFEYIVSGTPIIAIGICENSDAGKILTKTKTGIICLNSELKIENTLREFISTRKISQFSPDVTEIKKYSRKLQARRMIKIFEKYCDSVKENIKNE